ncbi:sulfatase-like hydrolase/transferase [Stigmatella aurantiaca]|uniref:Sulfatase n=1 Tax=Stigmatella aurantiaca (strain DW4/3-1) TaxID=378806 RepID=E3FCP8_STIAD|nr:sulfatase-like hydrolase/transferase [Stigmatella aurantiaca]ADO72546.1 Sulfatase [Stigmatella aurantiaca DW4/3-1]
MDQHIARVLQTLEESSLRDDTLVVFMSDHGEYGGAHGLMMEKWHTA